MVPLISPAMASKATEMFNLEIKSFSCSCQSSLHRRKWHSPQYQLKKKVWQKASLEVTTTCLAPRLRSSSAPSSFLTLTKIMIGWLPLPTSTTSFYHHHPLASNAGDAHHVDDSATLLVRQLHHHLAQLAVPHLSDLFFSWHTTNTNSNTKNTNTNTRNTINCCSPCGWTLATLSSWQHQRCRLL